MSSTNHDDNPEAQQELLTFLRSRVSHPRLIAPAPSPNQLEDVFQSALRTPDHMRLKPWRYLVVEGESLVRLGELFCTSARKVKGELTDVQEEKYRAMPLRAPMIIIGISKNIEHAKVPLEEQVVSCGVGMGYMLLALQAQGYGGMWRTGELALNDYVKDGLGLSDKESLVGFLYVGTPQGDSKKIAPVDSGEHFQAW